MWLILIVVLLGSIAMTRAETSSENTLVEERLMRAGEQLSLAIHVQPPDADSYLNFNLVKNAPHKMNLSSELTKIIREWSPRLLSLDPTTPYYFSNFSNSSLAHKNHNLLHYFRAIEFNTTLAPPYVSVFPQYYRNALPLPSIFECEELVRPSSSPFFHNIELIVGPGQTELPFKRELATHSRFYCSLYGWPHFVLVNQTKQPTIKFDAQTLLSYKNIADVDFIRTTLAPGSCLSVPADWVTGVQLNNSISMVLTLKKIEPAPGFGEEDFAPWPCTKIDGINFDKVNFVEVDTFNASNVGILVYFYQYLNPPVFDKQYTSETFLANVRMDRNLTQLIMKWTPELIALIQNDLFKQLDLNEDGQFSVEDYFSVNQSTLTELHQSINDILEKLRQAVLTDYYEMQSSMAKLVEQLKDVGLTENMKGSIESIVDQLPEGIKERLKEQNIDVQGVLDSINAGETKRPKRPSSNKQREREDDANTLFENDQQQESIGEVVQDEEEEITAEPPISIPENDTHRIEL